MGHNRLRCPNPPISTFERTNVDHAGTSAEPVDVTGTSTETGGEVGNSSTATHSTGRPRTSRKCSLCGVTGHTRRRCDQQFPISPTEDDENCGNHENL